MQEPTQPSEATPKTASNKKCVKQKRSCIDNDAMEKAMAELNKPSDEFDIFGEYVASELRSLQFDHNKRKLKRIIQKAILDMSEIDDNERSSSALSTHSHTSSVYSKDSEECLSSVYSPPPAIQPIQSHLQTSSLLSIAQSSVSDTSNDTNFTTRYFQELGK